LLLIIDALMSNNYFTSGNEKQYNSAPTALTNTVVAELGGSTPLIKSATVHDPEPVQPTSHP
jgi:hypothetical protein